MIEVVTSGINELMWYFQRFLTYITGSTRLLPLFAVGISISVIFFAIVIIRKIIRG